MNRGSIEAKINEDRRPATAPVAPPGVGLRRFPMAGLGAADEGRNRDADPRGQQRRNATHASTMHVDTWLLHKGYGPWTAATGNGHRAIGALEREAPCAT